ncbi:imidazole glycerol phosphate synthase subunit HisH [Fimbriimonas ginsengisoli]|uniref:Imidazole glycerol phosphate synthase subunit HisH n=1 Tax=Fimbriimonas ginsengisoli Gsoil 348 TaxID=661478 RepID=A0A068NZ03_FIMGI|nr:imidazole glycerol phosphate synthase subunit HisH [Fimbriimonas ginsengisoli]AIE87724.1 imidazole glycerol phosphate synthase, glutamine amidotransferase subunit [Fimbriimonas ginsengisoli Gsoil 348]
MITILDYGMGNIRSVEKALESLGAACQVRSDLAGCDRLIIPGVGAFGAAMERVGPLAGEIRAFAATGAPVLGICLGQQLLFDSSEELGEHQGLGLIPGRVRYFPPDMGLKVPHMGWSPITICRQDGIGRNVKDGEQAYFVHSLYTDCADKNDVAAVANYGIPFAAMVQRENIYGAQFHPEKSGDVGMRILRSFLEC